MVQTIQYQKYHTKKVSSPILYPVIHRKCPVHLLLIIFNQTFPYTALLQSKDSNMNSDGHY